MGETACRGIRGATTVDGDLGAATAELLEAIVGTNEVRLEDVAACVFTLTDELAGENPAAVARAYGWSEVPLLLVREHGGGTSVPRVLRVLVLWNTEKPQADVRHVYQRDAVALRPDLVGGKP